MYACKEKGQRAHKEVAAWIYTGSHSKYKHVANQGRNSLIHTVKVAQTFLFFSFFFTSLAQVTEATSASLLDSKKHFPATQEP